ncbi:MAG: hypothetical protein ACO38V_05150 [Phycisphaerales bacterium]
MSFSRTAAANVVPLLSRVLLAGLMVPMGWTMLTTQATYQGEDLEWLQKLGVIESPAAALASFRHAVAQDGSGAGSGSDAAAVPPSSDSGASGASSDETPPVDGPGIVAPADPPPTQVETTSSDAIAGEDPTTEAPAIEPVPGELEGVEARRLYGYAITFADAGWPQPKLLAWGFAFLMLVGGALTLLGLLTRIWGLLFAAAAGSLFWIESWPIVAEHWMFGVDDASFLVIAAQSTLAVLSLGLVFSGGGLLSLDHAVFRRRDGSEADDAMA